MIRSNKYVTSIRERGLFEWVGKSGGLPNTYGWVGGLRAANLRGRVAILVPKRDLFL